jgi:dTDP-4-amino-4,6-dideoxygalactose transaminase
MHWDAIRLWRRANYDYLLQAVAGIPQVVPIFPKLQAEIMPMGLPVYFRGGSRDRVNEELGKASIGLVIHWEELLHNPRTAANKEAAEMASSMLTLVCDQRTSRLQLDYLVRKLKKAIQAVG